MVQLEKTSTVQKTPSERMCTKKNTETTKRRHEGQNTKHTHMLPQIHSRNLLFKTKERQRK